MPTEPEETEEESSVDKTGKLLTTLFKVPKHEVDVKKPVKGDSETGE
jgi:hypothetical protein